MAAAKVNSSVAPLSPPSRNRSSIENALEVSEEYLNLLAFAA